MTLKELELYIARQVSIYHKTTHRTLGMPPASAWERAWTINGQPTLPSVPDSAEHFLLTFLPGESRTVTREGVRLHSLQYQSDALAPLIEPGTQRMVRFDPRDLSRVFVETANEHVPVSLSRHVAPPFSLWEWREIHRRERELGQARDPGRIADELRANRALIEESAKSGRRVIAARRVAREDDWQAARTSSGRPDQVLRAGPGAIDPICRVEE
jgi:putative transposase